MRKAAKRSGSFNASVPTARLTRFTQGRWPRTAAPSRSTPVGTALRKRVRRSAVRYQSYPPNPSSSPSDRKSTRLNSSHDQISYAVFCLKKKKHKQTALKRREHRDHAGVLRQVRLLPPLHPVPPVRARLRPESRRGGQRALCDELHGRGE